MKAQRGNGRIFVIYAEFDAKMRDGMYAENRLKKFQEKAASYLPTSVSIETDQKMVISPLLHKLTL